MNKRTFLQLASTAAATTLSVATTATRTTADTDSAADEDDEFSCAAVETLPSPGDDDDVAALSDPDFIADTDGAKRVRAYWRDNEWFRDAGFPNRIAVGVIDGTQIVLNESRDVRVTDDVVAHELAHTLGYRHGDDEGIVNPDTVYARINDKHPHSDLRESTRDVAETFEAYTPIYDWDASDLGKVTDLFGAGDTSASVLGHAVTRYASDTRGESLLFQHSFDGFGGRFDGSFQPGRPDNVYRGHFYGLNSTR